MSQTKKLKPDGVLPDSSARVSGSTPEVLTLGEAAAYLRLSEAAVLRLIDEQGLPARRLGKEWRLLKSAIEQWLAREPRVDPSKAAQLAAAGSWKDDPLVEEELREAYRRRRRSVTEEDS